VFFYALKILLYCSYIGHPVLQTELDKLTQHSQTTYNNKENRNNHNK